MLVGLCVKALPMNLLKAVVVHSRLNLLVVDE
jgi:hypothetical protein